MTTVQNNVQNLLDMAPLTDGPLHSKMTNRINVFYIKQTNRGILMKIKRILLAFCLCAISGMALCKDIDILEGTIRKHWWQIWKPGKFDYGILTNNACNAMKSPETDIKKLGDDIRCAGSHNLSLSDIERLGPHNLAKEMVAADVSRNNYKNTNWEMCQFHRNQHAHEMVKAYITCLHNAQKTRNDTGTIYCNKAFIELLIINFDRWEQDYADNISTHIKLHGVYKKESDPAKLAKIKQKMDSLGQKIANTKIYKDHYGYGKYVQPGAHFFN